MRRILTTQESMMQSNSIINDIEKIDQFINLSTHLFSASLITELLAALMLAAGVVMIFLLTQRPGRVMMLSGLLCYVLLAIPFLYFEMTGVQHLSAATKKLLLYIPLALSVSFFVIAWGFVKFAWSFRQNQ